MHLSGASVLFFFPSFLPACLHAVAALLLIASDANVPYFYLIPPVSV